MLAQLERTPESMVVLGAEPTRFDPSLGYIHTKGGDDAVAGDRLLPREARRGRRRASWGSRATSTGTPPATAYASGGRARPTAPRCPSSSSRSSASPAARRPRRPTAAPPSAATRSTRSCGPAWSASSSRGSSGGPTSAPGRASSACCTTSGSPRSVPRSSSTPRTPSSPAWTADRSSRSARAGLIVVTHEDAVYVLDRQKALDAGILERLRSLLAASSREDLL